jgi:hypothetical protein
VTYDPATGGTFNLKFGETVAPESFFSQELPFILDLKAKYNSTTGLFGDSFLDALFKIIIQLKNTNPSSLNDVTQNGSYLTELPKAQSNVDVYLADVIYSKITGAPRKFSPTDYKLYFYQSSGNSIIEWAKNIDTYVTSEGDGLLNRMPLYLVRLNTLALIDKDSYYTTLIARRFANSLLFEYLNTSVPGFGTFADFKGHNNLCMRSMAAIAIEDFTIPDANHRYGALSKLQGWIQEKYSADGGYGEGSDYLEYLNEILLPYMFIGYKCGWIDPSNSALKTVQSSGYWLAHIVDPSGYYPEIDDACGSQNYMIAPYIGLNGKAVFTYLAKKGQDGRTSPLDFLTYSPNTLWPYKRWDLGNPVATLFPYVVVHGGIGKINIISGGQNDLYTSLTLITEQSSIQPDLKIKGGSHDQQDHGSIVLRRAKGNNIDQLILDPLYSGYQRKVSDGAEMLYINHNTLQFSGTKLLLLAGNIKIPTEISGGVDPCPLVDINLFGNHFKYYSGCGGGSSDVSKSFSNGIDARIQLDVGGSYNRAVVNERWSDIFLVFDRVNPGLFPTNMINCQYTLHYNLPAPGTPPAAPTDAIKAPNIVEATGVVDRIQNTQGQSKIRISAFCSRNLNAVTTTAKSFYHRDYEDLDKIIKINAAEFKVDYVPNSGMIGFISIIEPKDISESFGEFYSNVTLANNVLCVKKEENGTIFYAFENLLYNNNSGTVTIPGVQNKHFEFRTDAEFGFVQFDSQHQRIDQSFLYNVKSASYNGANLNLPNTLLNNLEVRSGGVDYLMEFWDGGGYNNQYDPRFENNNNPSVLLRHIYYKINSDVKGK